MKNEFEILATELRKAFKDIKLNNQQDWQKLATEVKYELETYKTKLLDLEPYFDAWIINLNKELVNLKIYDNVMKNIVLSIFNEFNNIQIDSKKRIIILKLDGVNYCLNKEQEKMSIKIYENI